MTPQLTVPILRELLRHYQAWRSLYEAREVDDVICSSQGFCVSLWDLEYIIENLVVLPPRQRQAIQFCLIENMKETEAARRMGVSPTNPVAMYASSGMIRIIAMIREGLLPRFTETDQERAG